MTQVYVPAGRAVRWVDNFSTRHGAAVLSVGGGALRGVAPDGSTFLARLPFARGYDGPADPVPFAAAAVPPEDWGVLLVRRGGFAVARLAGDRLAQSKVGRRHVQGRTKAGGWSQQRFARRRDNQARVAFEAATEHAARILAGLAGPLVTGGDRAAVDDVLTDARLRRIDVVGPWLAVPDPRRDVLESAVRDAASLSIEVHNEDTDRS